MEATLLEAPPRTKKDKWKRLVEDVVDLQVTTEYLEPSATVVINQETEGPDLPPAPAPTKPAPKPKPKPKKKPQPKPKPKPKPKPAKKKPAKKPAKKKK